MVMRSGTWMRLVLVLVAALAAAGLLPGCSVFRDRPQYPPPPPEEEPSPEAPSPSPSPSASPTLKEPEGPGPVAPAPEGARVRAWAEPRLLPPVGGQAQILVLVRKRTGDPLPGVQVRLHTSEGALFSTGKILTTDAAGRTRDRLTTRVTSVVTVNAGGTLRTVLVPVASPVPPPPPAR
jgi:hypothetical protein